MHEEYFFKKYYGFVMGIGRTYVKSEDLAQEITQDTFLKFFDTVGRLNEEVVLKPWLRRIAVNTSIDYYRKKSKIPFSRGGRRTQSLASQRGCSWSTELRRNLEVASSAPGRPASDIYPVRSGGL